VRGYAHLSGNGAYDQQFNSGPFWMFAVGFFRASPVLCLAAVIGLGVPMARLFRSRNLRNFDIATAIAILTCCMLLLQVVTTRYNYRYSAPIYGTLCLLGGIGMETVLMSLAKLLAPLGRSVAWAILGFAVAVAGLRDFNFARDVLLPTGIQDLALRTVAGFPPAPLPSSDAR